MAIPPRRRPDPSARPPAGGGGFTLIELLIGAVLITIALSMAATLAGITNRSMISSETIGRQDTLIESDIAAIRDLAERYTWCTGAGTTAATAVCASVTPRTENYYFPNIGNAAVSITAFENACRPAATPTIDELNAPLVTAINARAQPAGITRTVANDDVAGYRLRITYAGTNVNRVVLLVPTVAAWC